VAHSPSIHRVSEAYIANALSDINLAKPISVKFFKELGLRKVD